MLSHGDIPLSIRRVTEWLLLQSHSALPKGWTSSLMDPHVASSLSIHISASHMAAGLPHFSLQGVSFFFSCDILNVTQQLHVLLPLPSIFIFVTVPFITRDLIPDHDSVYLCHTSLHPTRASSSSTFRASGLLKSTDLWVLGMVLDLYLLRLHGWNRLCILMRHQVHSVTPPTSPWCR